MNAPTNANPAAQPLADPPAGHDQSPERIQGMFAAITPSYDRLNHLLSGSLDKHWWKLTARAVLGGLAPCEKILDVATGTGDLANQLRREAEKNVGPGRTKIYGADFTKPMIRLAGQKYGQDPHRWTEADGLNLPYPDSAFDAATIAYGLRNMADKRRGLAEMVRVVRPGGRVAILEFSQPPNPVVRWGYDLYSYQVMPRLGAWLSGSKAYLYLADSIRGFWGPDQLAEEMQRAGLSEPVYLRLMFGVVCLHLGTKL